LFYEALYVKKNGGTYEGYVNSSFTVIVEMSLNITKWKKMIHVADPRNLG